MLPFTDLAASGLLVHGGRWRSGPSAADRSDYKREDRCKSQADPSPDLHRESACQRSLLRRLCEQLLHLSASLKPPGRVTQRRELRVQIIYRHERSMTVRIQVLQLAKAAQALNDRAGEGEHRGDDGESFDHGGHYGRRLGQFYHPCVERRYEALVSGKASVVPIGQRGGANVR